MRRKGVIFLVILIGIFVGLSFILTDKWAENLIEKLGSRAVGAKVEIDGLDIDLFSSRTKWDSLQITDPQNTLQNILATGPSDLDFNFLPLLSKKVIIETIKVTNAESGTSRSTDGKLILPPKKQKKKKTAKPNIFTKTAQKLQDDVTKAPAWNLSQFTRKVNVDSIVALLEVKAPDKIDSTYKDLNARYTKWDNILKSNRIEKDLKDLETMAKSLNIEDVKDVQKLIKMLDTAQKMKIRVDSLKSFTDRTRTGLKTDLENGQKSVRLVDNWIKDDYNRALSKAKIPDITAKNIGKFIFGNQVVSNLEKVLNITQTVRTYSAKLGSDKPKKEKPPRLKGQDIHFGKKAKLPKFWIQHVDLSGNAYHIDLEGKLDHLVSDQKLIGKPTTLAVDGTRRDGAAISLDGLFNYLEDTEQESYQMQMSGMELAGVTLSKSQFLPYKVKKGKGTLSAKLAFEGNTFTGVINFKASGLQFQTEGQKPKNKVEEIIRSVVESTSTVTFTSKIKGKGDDIQFDLDSNLDELFARKLRAIVSDEIESAKKKLLAEVDKQVKPYKDKLDKLVNEKQKEIEDKMADVQKQVDDKLKEAEAKKKEIEDKIEAEKKKKSDKLENDIKNKLDDILN